MVCSCAPRLLQIRPAFACCAFETGHFGPGHLGAKPVAASETNLAPTKWLLKFSQLRSYSGRTIFLGEEREEVVRLEGESERSGQQRTTSDSDRMM